MKLGIAMIIIAVIGIIFATQTTYPLSVKVAFIILWCTIIISRLEIIILKGR